MYMTCLPKIGFRYLKGKAEQDFGFGYNSPIDQLISVQFGSNALRQIGGSIGESNWINTYLNADYSYADKYFLSFNMAMDGSSRFGKNIPECDLTWVLKFCFPSFNCSGLVNFFRKIYEGKTIRSVEIKSFLWLIG